jgi:predicted DNA-binding transcriptional regulator AlpA
MPFVPPDQRSPHPVSCTSTAAPTQDDDHDSPHQRQGDRSSADADDADADDAEHRKELAAEKLAARRKKLAARRSKLAQTGFPTFIRYDDLEAAGLVGSWTQLTRMIKDEGFPHGVLLSGNIRAWRVDEIEDWLASRPTARKAMPEDAVHPRVRDKRIREKRVAQAAQPPDANATHD